MDHAEAHERIADLALEPRRLGALGGSPDADDAALREHIGGCPRCQAELTEWRQFQRSLGAVIKADHREQLEPILPPDDLRASVLAAAHAESPRGQAGVAVVRPARSGLSGRALLALAAVLALVAVGVGLLAMREQSARLDTAALERRWLSDTVTGLGRILATPDHHLVTLRTADGADGGSLAWSSHDLVVLSSSLAAPAAGQVYRCWLSYEGRETAVGVMWFVDGNAFWAGSTQGWATIDLDPERRFLVTLEPAGDAGPWHSGPIMLEATLGS
jgi:hypothetical protein